MTVIVNLEDRVNAARGGRGLEVLLSSDDSRGTTAVLDCVIPPATFGPPLHRHPESEETFVVISGVLLVRHDETTTSVGAGGLVHIPRGTAHTFATGPDSGARFITIHTPGGFEGFHLAARDAAQEAGRTLTPGEMIAIAGRFDWELAGPPLLPDGTLGSPGA